MFDVGLFMLYFPIYYRVSGFLRLILLPTEWYQRYTEDEDDHVSLSEIYYSEDFTYHFIDQFDVCYNTYSSNSYCARISFILPENHRLGRTHSGIIVDLKTDCMISYLGSIGKMRQQENRKSFPISHVSHISDKSTDAGIKQLHLRNCTM